MKKQKYALIRFFVILGIVSLACGVKINMGGTPTVSPPSTQIQQPIAPLPTINSQPTISIQPQATVAIPPTPNSEVQPTVEPQPTVGTESSDSQSPADFQQIVEGYYQKGYLSSTNGEYHRLEDYSMEFANASLTFAKRETGYSPKDFMVKAHFKWQSAITNPDPAGCGWAFRTMKNDSYLFFADREQVYIGMMKSNQWTHYGRTTGSGWIGLGNPADADVALIVNKGKAYVIINDTFTSSHTLDTDYLTGAGELNYAVVAGTYKNYGTRCEMTNVDLWISNP